MTSDTSVMFRESDVFRFSYRAEVLERWRQQGGDPRR